MRPVCSIAGIRTTVGEVCDIGALVEEGVSPEQVETMRERGFLHYSRSDRTPAELAVQAATETLASTGIAPAAVSAVLYASNSMWREDFYLTPAAQRMMVALGLVKTPLLGVFLGNCSNSTDTLRHAANLVKSEGLRNILVIVADAAAPGRATRLPVGEFAVIGDAAISFIVNPAGEGDFDVLGIGSAYNAKACEMAYHSGAYMLAVAVGMREAVDRACAAAGITRSGLGRFVMSNLQPRFCRATAKGLGFREDQWHSGRLTEVGHCSAADSLMNLVDMAASAPLASGEKVLVYSQAPSSWGAAVVSSTF